MVLPELHLEEDQDVAQVDVRLFVENWVNARSVVVSLVVATVQDEFTPNLHDLTEESLCILELVVLLEQLAHIVVGAAHTVRFRSVLLALHVDALCHVFLSVFVRVWVVLGKEEPSKRLVKPSVVFLVVLF